MPFDVNIAMDLINLSIRKELLDLMSYLLFFFHGRHKIDSRCFSYNDTIFTIKMFLRTTSLQHFEYYSNIIEFSTTQKRKLLTDVLYIIHYKLWINIQRVPMASNIKLFLHGYVGNRIK